MICHNYPIVLKHKWFVYILHYYLRGFPCLGYSFFWFKNIPTPLCLSRDKTKGQSDKNTIVTPTKTLPKKYGNSHVDFQIVLSTLSTQKKFALSTYKLEWMKNYDTTK